MKHDDHFNFFMLFSHTTWIIADLYGLLLFGEEGWNNLPTSVYNTWVHRPCDRTGRTNLQLWGMSRCPTVLRGRDPKPWANNNAILLMGMYRCTSLGFTYILRHTNTWWLFVTQGLNYTSHLAFAFLFESNAMAISKKFLWKLMGRNHREARFAIKRDFNIKCIPNVPQ